MYRPPRREGSQGFLCGVALPLPGRRSQAGRTEQFELELNHIAMKRCSLARSCINLMPDSGICKCVQWSPLQQHGMVWKRGPGVYDEDHPVPAGHQKPLQVGHRRRQRHLMDDDELARDVIKAVFLLSYGRKLALTVRAAEA